MAATLDHGPAAQRPEAEKALVSLGPDGVEAAVRAVPGSKGSQRLMRVPAQVGEKAIPRLLQLLQDDKTREGAGMALYAAATPDAQAHAPELIACMNKTELKHVCGRALIQVLTPRGAQYAPALARALKSKDADVRAYAATALGQLGGRVPSDLVPQLQAALHDKDPQVRWSAAITLGKMGHKAAPAAEDLKALSQDSNPDVRREAADAVKKIGG